MTIFPSNLGSKKLASLADGEIKNIWNWALILAVKNLESKKAWISALCIYSSQLYSEVPASLS